MRIFRGGSQASFGAFGLMLLGGMLSLATPAHATPILVTGSQGQLAAEASFSVSGANLIITLTNSSAHDVTLPDQVLTGVFFDIVGPLITFTPASGSVTLAPGSTVVFGSAPGGVVGGEFAFASGISGSAPNGANYGISSAGLGIFGNANFPGANLQGPTGVNGLQYGITSASDNPATGNSPVTGSNALINNSIVIVLPGLPFGFDPATMIYNVSFQYGTSLTEPNVPGDVPPVPGPAALALLAFACVLSRKRARV